MKFAYRVSALQLATLLKSRCFGSGNACQTKLHLKSVRFIKFFDVGSAVNIQVFLLSIVYHS